MVKADKSHAAGTMYRQFFAYARERQSIFLKKFAGLPREEWTNDQLLAYYKFCCIFREDDRTTIWLRENVREKIRGPELLLATIVFRWFNRISTGEAIFTERDLYGDGRTAWEVFIETKDIQVLRQAILEYCGSGPYVTGAYCIIGMPHMSKLDGILACINNIMTESNPGRIIPGFTKLFWRDIAQYIWDHPGAVTLESVWEWLRLFPRSGDFMAYEVVTDLNHTAGMLVNAPDVMTWANAGPGAIRGLNRIHDRMLEQKLPKAKTNQEMLNILEASRLPANWPQYDPARVLYVTDSEVYVHRGTVADQWPAWDMRTVEHTLCEFDKYSRIIEGGHVKGIYKG